MEGRSKFINDIKPNDEKKRLRTYMYHIDNALRTFDDVLTQKDHMISRARNHGKTYGLWSNYEEAWSDTIDGRKQYTHLRNIYMPKLIARLNKAGKIDEDQVNSITNMIKSPDRADWYMAIVSVKAYIDGKV